MDKIRIIFSPLFLLIIAAEFHGAIGYANDYVSEFEQIQVNGLPFVDKTEFIKIFLNYTAACLYISAPPRFGKTLNQGMLRLFLDAEIDDTGSVIPPETSYVRKGFEILNIGKDKVFLKEHFQKYKIISIDFSPLLGTIDYKSFKDRMCIVICKMVEDFSYVEKTSNISWSDFKKCKRVCKGNFGDYLSTGLYLSKQLWYKHKKPVVVLADEFDALVQKMFQVNVKDADKIFHDLGIFLKMMSENNTYVKRSLLVGCLTLNGVMSPLLNTLKHVNFGKDPVISRYFGFTEKEVKTLLIKNSMSDYWAELKRWFDGYKIMNKEEETIFNPLSISESVKKKKIALYWTSRTANYATSMSIFFSRPEIGNIVDIMSNNGTATFSFNSDKVSFNFLKKLRRNLQDNQRRALDECEADLYLSFLVDMGYLTLFGSEQATEIRSVNLETSTRLRQYLTQSKYYVNTYNLTPEKQTDLCNAFLEFNDSLHALQRLIKSVHTILIDGRRHVDRRISIIGPIFYILNKNKYKFSFVETSVEVVVEEEPNESETTGRKKTYAKLDMLLLRKDAVGIVFEAKREASSKKVLGQIFDKKYFYVFEQKYTWFRLEHEVFVGINVDENWGCEVSSLWDSIEVQEAKSARYPP